MTPTDAVHVIEQYVETTWAGATVVAWPNIPFTPPATANWLKLDFVWGTGAMETKDGRSIVTGLLQLGIFGPKDTGDGALLTLAQTARAMVNRKRFASPNQDVAFGAVSGPRPLFEESWRMLVVSAPFQVFESVP